MGGSSPLSISNSIIPQLDGNISLLSESDKSSVCSECSRCDDQSKLSECLNSSYNI